MRKGEQPPWIVSDDLWERIEPLLPAHPRRHRYPGRRRIPDRQVLRGILFVLHTGIRRQSPAGLRRLDGETAGVERHVIG